MCNKCNLKHQIGYQCPCECHQVIDRIIVDRERKAGEGK
jgi:hypothetical protein